MSVLLRGLMAPFSPVRHAYFLQSTFAECGLACLGLVSGEHGLVISMRELRSRFHVSLHGTTMRRLIQISEQLNLTARGVHLELEELGALRLPAVLHWDMNHFVVLLKVRKGQVVIFDPAVGKRRLPMAEVSKHFTGVALELWPGLQFRKERRLKPLALGDVLGAISGLVPALGSLLLLSLVLSAAGLLAPLQLQLLIDQAVPQSDGDLLLLIVVGFAILQLFSTCGTILRRFLTLRISQSLSLGMQGNIVRHLMALPLRYFQSRHIGDLLNKLGSAGTVHAFLLSGAVSTAVDGLVAIAALGLLFTYGIGLALLTCLAVLATEAVDLGLVGLRKQLAHEQQLASSREHTLIVEMLSGVQALKLSGRTSDRVAVWEAAFSQVLSRQSQQEGLSIVSDSVQGILGLLFNGLILYLLVQSVFRQEITVGMMMSFLAYKSYCAGALSGLAGSIVAYRMLAVPLEWLADIVTTAPDSQHAAEVDLGDASIEFRDVWFRYDEALPYILKGASFRVEPGEHVAIAGASGVGKSTILKLLLRIETPERGEILVGGQPIAALNLQGYRDRLGVVMQYDQLFTGSLIENITMFAEAVDEERLERACQIACLSDDIAKMPMRMLTMVGDMGSALSGGQKQRLILARAIYREPSLLLMDEATAHLDPDTETQITQNVSALRCTRVTIAHRRETLETAERVLVLNTTNSIRERIKSQK